jgi:hypothetical protein
VGCHGTYNYLYLYVRTDVSTFTKIKRLRAKDTVTNILPLSEDTVLCCEYKGYF